MTSLRKGALSRLTAALLVLSVGSTLIGPVLASRTAGGEVYEQWVRSHVSQLDGDFVDEALRRASAAGVGSLEQFVQRFAEELLYLGAAAENLLPDSEGLSPDVLARALLDLIGRSVRDGFLPRLAFTPAHASQTVSLHRAMGALIASAPPIIGQVTVTLGAGCPAWEEFRPPFRFLSAAEPLGP